MLGMTFANITIAKTHRVDDRDACHLIWISEYTKSPIPTLAEVEDRIYQMLVRQQEVTLLKALLENASKDVVVKRYASTIGAVQKTVTSDLPASIQQN